MGLFRRKLRVRDLLNISRDRITRSKLTEPEFMEKYVVRNEPQDLISRFIRLFRPVRVSQVYKLVSESNSGAKYINLIETNHKFNKNTFERSHVKVFCSCPDFMYRSSYALNEYDNLFLNKATESHLKVALTIKPTKVTTTPICKHLYASLFNIRDNFNRY